MVYYMARSEHTCPIYTDTNRQETLTNGTIGKKSPFVKKPYDSYHWYEWKAPQSIGIPFVNYLRAVRKRFLDWCHSGSNRFH